MNKQDFIDLKLSLMKLSNEFHQDNLETSKKIIISHIQNLDCKVLNENIQGIQQVRDISQLKK